MKTHKVNKGIFAGLEFNGTEYVTSNGEKRVWDNETNGRSYAWWNVHRFRSVPLNPAYHSREVL